MKMKACSVTTRMWKMAQPLPGTPLDPPGQQRDQEEDELPAKHVAEKPEPEAEGLRELPRRRHDDVDGREVDAEGVGQELLTVARKPLTLMLK